MLTYADECWLEVSGASGHRRAAQYAAEREEESSIGGKQKGEGGGEAEFPAGGGLVGFCDMTTMGGGWLMCYTSSQHVDLANEYSYDFRNAYGALSVSICHFVPLKQVN